MARPQQLEHFHPDLFEPYPEVHQDLSGYALLLAQEAVPPPILPCTPDPNNPSQCLYDPSESPPEDVDPTREGGQLGQSCNNGGTIGSINVSGTNTYNGPVTLNTTPSSPYVYSFGFSVPLDTFVNEGDPDGRHYNLTFCVSDTFGDATCVMFGVVVQPCTPTNF